MNLTENMLVTKVDESKDREQQGERNIKHKEITRCVLCDSRNLHKVEGMSGRYECVDCGGKFVIKDGKLVAIILWGEPLGEN